ncbi:MAG: hypothetical protein N2053_05080 [Chitinispirillaceae bacterium]|nr:hypothetical protein [Chitinispirillaceae bacterium]
MKKLSFILLIPIILSLGNAESDIHTVKAEYERCLSVMERVERTIRRYEELMKSLQNKLKNFKDENVSLSKEITSLENRLEYFRNRYERAKGQADKINSDIKEIKGPTCPSCIESAVNLYCRNTETLQNELEEYTEKALELDGKLSMSGTNNEENKPLSNRDDSKDKIYISYRTLTDSLYKALNICEDSVAEIFSLQIAKNISKADSLYNIKETSSAFKHLNIAEALINKVKKRCYEIK